MTQPGANLIGNTWRATGYRPAVEVLELENYGGVGALIETQQTPTFVPPKYTEYDPYIPQWNTLTPIVWEEIVVSQAEQDALAQLQLLQVPGQDPAYWSPPGPASVQ